MKPQWFNKCFKDSPSAPIALVGFLHKRWKKCTFWTCALNIFVPYPITPCDIQCIAKPKNKKDNLDIYYLDRCDNFALVDRLIYLSSLKVFLMKFCSTDFLKWLKFKSFTSFDFFDQKDIRIKFVKNVSWWLDYLTFVISGKYSSNNKESGN